jgi:hypothetical protein
MPRQRRTAFPVRGSATRAGGADGRCLCVRVSVTLLLSVRQWFHPVYGQGEGEFFIEPHGRTSRQGKQGKQGKNGQTLFTESI